MFAPRSQRQLTGDIVNDDGNGRVPDVRGDETPEPLLPGSVPELQSNCAVLEVHGLGEEVYANSGLKQKKTITTTNDRRATNSQKRDAIESKTRTGRPTVPNVSHTLVPDD